MPIALPGPAEVPAGPRRELVMALYVLYGHAGKPATRIISKHITDEESWELETVSHETINSVLRGKSVPSWAKLRSIITVLCLMSDQEVDIRERLVEFNTLWIRIDSPPAPSEPDAGPPSADTGTPKVAERPGPIESRVHGAVPVRSALFTGRERLVDEIDGRLHQSGNQPLILCGPIGAGKTQLAAEYARQHRSDYAITWWVRAGHVQQAREDLRELAHRLEVPVDEDARRPFEQLFLALAQWGPYLLVFDGVLSGDVRPLMQTRGGHVLATTRYAGWAQHSPHDTLGVPDLGRGEAAQLLRKQDPRIAPAQLSRLLEVVGRSPFGLVEVCRLYRERRTTWPDLADRLADPANRVLTGPGRPPRRAVEAVRSVLLDRLAGEAGLLTLLTLLLGFGPSPVHLWMLRAGAGGDVSAGLRRILGDPVGLRRALRVLVVAGLIRHDDDDAVEMPAVIRLVLRELVPAARTEVNRRDVVEILVLADPAHPDDPRTSARHRAITPHLRPAALVDWARPSVYRTVHHQMRFLFLDGDLQAAQQLGRDAEAALRRQSVLLPTDELVLQIKRDLANALRAGGRYDEAFRLTGEAMEVIAADPAYQPGHAIALELARSRGHDLRIAGRYHEAYELDELTHLWHTNVFADHDTRRLASRYNLSVSRRFLGRYAEAAESDRADLHLLLAEHAGDDHHQVRLRNALAEDLYGLGEYEEILDLLAPVLTGEAGRELQRARRMTGVVYRRLGRLVPAIEQLGVCYHACLNEWGERQELTLAACMSFGNALRELGQYETALHYCRRAAAGYAAAMGERNPLARVAWVNTAAVHLAMGEAERAAGILEEAHPALAEDVGEQHPFTVLAEVNRAAASAPADPATARELSGHAYEQARTVFGDDHLDTVLAAAGLAADRAAQEEDDGLAPNLDQVLATLRRRFGAAQTLVLRVADGSRPLVDIEVPSA